MLKTIFKKAGLVFSLLLKVELAIWGIVLGICAMVWVVELIF